eukprot:12562064-Alexandrium_andersonii.AAC.1
MSASLVGSEMCIRDRCGFTPRSGVDGIRAPAVRSSLWSGENVFGRFCGAVSYTHLTLPTICSV